MNSAASIFAVLDWVFFENWCEQDIVFRLDLILSLHSMESADGPWNEE